MKRFEGRVAIVTGGSSGIGRAAAERLASEGAKLVVVGRDGDKAAAVAALIGDGAVGLACDVADERQVEACIATTCDRLGRLDVIVNNAGAMIFKPIVETTHDDWMHILGVDLLGAAWFIRHGLPRMTSGGSIVNVTSIHAHMTSPLVATYAVAKAGVEALTRAASIEAKPLGIRVNAVAPGAVDTPMLWDNPNLKSGAEKLDPADVGQASDLAATIAFLASDDAAFVTGATLIADGGRLARL